MYLPSVAVPNMFAPDRDVDPVAAVHPAASLENRPLEPQKMMALSHVEPPAGRIEVVAVEPERATEVTRLRGRVVRTPAFVTLTLAPMS
jgi:hypothetical protein